MFEYLRKEMKAIEREKKYFEKHPLEQDKTIVIKFMFYLAIISSLLFSPQHLTAFEKAPRFILEWVCCCGYDNYDGIRYCPLCGEER